MSKTQKTMRDQLKAIDLNLHGARYIGFSGAWKGDGIDHINIGRQAKTALGSALEVSRVIPFKHPVFGKWRSIEAMVEFLRMEQPDERLRHMSGNEARTFLRQMNITRRLNIPNLRAVIIHSAYIRLLGMPNLVKEFRESELPFDSYRVTETGMRIRNDDASWKCGAFETIRKALQECREPDFSFLLDNKVDNFYDPILKRLMPQSSDEDLKLTPVRKPEPKAEKFKSSKKEQRPQNRPAVAEIPMPDLAAIIDVDAMTPPLNLPEAGKVEEVKKTPTAFVHSVEVVFNNPEAGDAQVLRRVFEFDEAFPLENRVTRSEEEVVFAKGARVTVQEDGYDLDFDLTIPVNSKEELLLSPIRLRHTDETHGTRELTMTTLNVLSETGELSEFYVNQTTLIDQGDEPQNPHPVIGATASVEENDPAGQEQAVSDSSSDVVGESGSTSLDPGAEIEEDGTVPSGTNPGS